MTCSLVMCQHLSLSIYLSDQVLMCCSSVKVPPHRVSQQDEINTMFSALNFCTSHVYSRESVLEDYYDKVLKFSAFSTFAVLSLSTHTSAKLLWGDYPSIYFTNDESTDSDTGIIIGSDTALLYSFVCCINIASQNKEEKYVIKFVKLIGILCFQLFGFKHF